MYPIEMECSDEAGKIVESVCELTKKYASLGLSMSKVEKIIAESFLNVKKRSGESR
jgi:hypothetical protein